MTASFTNLPERNSAVCRSINLVRDRAGRAGGPLSIIRESKTGRPDIIIARISWKTGAANFAARLTAPAAPGRWRDFPAGLRSGFGIALKRLKQSARCFRQCFQVFSSPVRHDHKVTRGDAQWNEKVFPDPTKVLSR